jgi:hypothetical protein
MRDNEAKQRLGYKHPKSLVRPDGSETLVGEDWKKRKQELWDRAKGLCEQTWFTGNSEMFRGTWIQWQKRCYSEGHDPHHIKPRSKGRDDRLSNLQLLCRMHHNLLDKRKVKWSKR